MRNRLIVLSTFLLVLSGLANAEEIKNRAFVGAGLGVSSVDNNVGTGLGYGVSGGYFVEENWGGGLFLKSGNHDNGVTSFTFGAEALFQFPEAVPGLSLGAILGTTKFSGSGFSGNFNLAAGGKVAYDYMLSSPTPISVGAEAALLINKPEQDTLFLFDGFAFVKFWFA